MAEIVGGKRRLNCKTILEKYAALKAIDNGESQALVAKRLGIAKQTISNWRKDKDKIYGTVDSNQVNKKRRRVKSSPYDQVDKAVYTWFVNARHKKIPLNHGIVQVKALEFAKEFEDCKDFRASDGWMDRWKKRYNVTFKTISGT